MSIIRTVDRSDRYQENHFQLRPSGRANRTATTVEYVGAITASSGTTGSVSPAWATSTAPGDLGILVVERSGDATFTNPSGWNLFSSTPVIDVADATGSTLSVHWKFATSFNESNASVTGTADHTIARIYVFRGVNTKPGAVYGSDTKTVASTSLTWPAITTSSINNMVVGIATRPDDSGSTSNFSAYTNANLTGIAEAGESGTTSGNGGGFTLWYGSKATIGSTGTTTATSVASTTNALYILALEPSLALPA